MDAELESMIGLFIQKRKELNQSLAKIAALSRQLEELKNGSSYRSPNILQTQARLNEQQNLALMHKQSLLMQRKCEIAGIDERIAELQKRLAMKRMLNQQLTSQMKSRTGFAYGLPNDSLNSGNPRLRSSVGPCNPILLNNNYNRTNVAAVEPFQRLTLTTNTNYGTNQYDKSDENLDPSSDISPSKQNLTTKYQNVPFRNKFSPVELNSNPYPPSSNMHVNNAENITNINNKTNCILNSQQHHQQKQHYSGNHNNNSNNKSLSQVSEMMISHSESPERTFDGNRSGDIVKPQSDEGSESFLVNSLKHKIHLRERPSPSGSSSSSSDQLPAGYSPSNKVFNNITVKFNSNNQNNINNENSNHHGNVNKSHSNNVNQSNDYYGSRGDNKNITANGDYLNADNYRCPKSSGYDINATSNEQLIECIRQNSHLVNQYHLHHQQKQQQQQHNHQHEHHLQQQQRQQKQKQKLELITKCVSDLPNNSIKQNGSSLEDQFSLSGTSVNSSGSKSSTVNHSHRHLQQQQMQQQPAYSFINNDTNSQSKSNNLCKSTSSPNVPTMTQKITSNACGTVYQGSYGNNKDHSTDHHHHANECIDRSDLMINKSVRNQQFHPHQHKISHQQSNSFIRNGCSNNNQESQIQSSFYDYSPSSSSSNNIYSCSIDVSSRSPNNDANSSLLSSISSSAVSSSSSSSSVPQQHQHQHLYSSSNLSSSNSLHGKNGYNHPSSSPSKESVANSQKIHINNNDSNNHNHVVAGGGGGGNGETISSSCECLPPTGKESNTSSSSNSSNNNNNSFPSMNQVNNNHHQHEDNDDADDYEDEAENNHADNNDNNNYKLVESRSTSTSLIINNKTSNSEKSASIYSRGDESVVINKETIRKEVDNWYSKNNNHNHNHNSPNIKGQSVLPPDSSNLTVNCNCKKFKSSLKKENNRLNQKKDHPGLTRRVSFDPLALLLDAALEGELDLVKKTSKIQDVSAANDEGITALHNTICAGHFEIVKYLVEIGCDVNAPDSDGWTPLHCAASCNNLTMVKYLVEHGACIFATTFPDKETAAQKCEEGEEGFDGCSQYLLHIQDALGVMNDGLVYAVYDYDAQSSDELSFKNGDAMTILRRGDEDEEDWWWARLNDKEGYVPRNLLGLYPRVKTIIKGKKDSMD